MALALLSPTAVAATGASAGARRAETISASLLAFAAVARRVRFRVGRALSVSLYSAADAEAMAAAERTRYESAASNLMIVVLACRFCAGFRRFGSVRFYSSMFGSDQSRYVLDFYSLDQSMDTAWIRTRYPNSLYAGNLLQVDTTTHLLVCGSRRNEWDAYSLCPTDSKKCY